MSTNFTATFMDSHNNAHIGTNFYISLLEFLLTAKQHLIAIGGEHGLTSIQAITLIILNDKGGCPMKRLCQLFHCDASNITGIVDGLENKGLVTRQNDPNDRRVKTVAISLAGKRLQQQILDRLAQDNGYMFDPLSPGEVAQFASIVEKIALNKKLAC